MTLRTLVLGLLFVAPLAACSGEDDTEDTDVLDTDVEDTDDTDASGPDLAAGAEVFANHCAGCHGADGTGNTGPNLNERVPGKTEADIESVVVNGSGYMSAISGLTDDEVTNVAAFVVDSFGD